MTRNNYLQLVAVCSIAASLGMTAPAAHAQFQANDKSVVFSGGLSHQQGSDTGTLTIDASYGFFTSPNLELGIQQTVNYNFNDNASDSWIASTTGFANYHFVVQSNPKFVPFVGAFLGGIYNEDDISGTIGPNVGFKYFLSDTTFVLTRYRYEWAFSELTSNSVNQDSSDGNHIVTVGFGYRF